MEATQIFICIILFFNIFLQKGFWKALWRLELVILLQFMVKIGKLEKLGFL